MNPRATITDAASPDAKSPELPPEPQGESMKFIYPSGSRPLAGYTIKRGVGRGGFGEVYYAQSDGGKEVALKLIRRNLDVELRGVTHCLNLKHPNLIALHDIRRDDHDDSWVVMEYVRGDGLDKVIERHPEGMPVGEVMRWMHGVGAGVAYLHDQGIVHRDLKPGNIFDDEGLVKIGDYGLSKFISASRRSGQTESVGTVHYMAPEVANGRYGKEIDIYALGVMLYEMLTGHVPFEGESVGEVLMKHLTAQPDVSRLSEPYRSVVARALTKDPDKRFGSVGEMLAALPPASEATAPAPLPLVVEARRPPSSAEPVVTEHQTENKQASPDGGQPQSPRGDAGAGPTDGKRAAAAAVASPVTDEEPIWRAVRGGFEQMNDAWRHADLPQPVRVLVIVLAVILGIQFAAPLLGVIIPLVVVYSIYYVIRAVVLAFGEEPSPRARPATAAARPVPAASPAAVQAVDARAQAAVRAAHRRSHRLRHEKSVPAMVLKSPRQKITELIGSLLLSAVVAIAVCVVMALLGPAMSDWFRIETPQQFGWLALMGIAGAWGLLIPAKFWEGARGEPIVRRFVLLCVGLGLGALGFLAQEALLVDLPAAGNVASLTGHTIGDPYDAAGAPTLQGYLTYFAFLFPVLRWWKQADPLRWSRLRIWPTAVCIVWAGVLNFAWPFPQPWGMMVAATIAISVQLSSPWLDPRYREPSRRVV